MSLENDVIFSDTQTDTCQHLKNNVTKAIVRKKQGVFRHGIILWLECSIF